MASYGVVTRGEVMDETRLITAFVRDVFIIPNPLFLANEIRSGDRKPVARVARGIHVYHIREPTQNKVVHSFQIKRQETMITSHTIN